MKKHIVCTTLCLLSFCMAFVLPQSEAMALSMWIVSGSLNKRLIQHIVKLHENEIRHCYEISLLKDKNLQGSVTTLFIILSDGSVEKALIKDTSLNNPELEQCIIDHIETWKFYAIIFSDQKTVVEYQFAFVSNYKQPKVLEHTRVILNEDDMKIEYFDAQPADDSK